MPLGLLLLFLLPFLETAEAGGCSGANREFRLDAPGNSLASNAVVDQDSQGICYAAAASVLLQSITPHHPQLSYVQLALNERSVDGAKGKLASGLDSFLSGGYVCKVFNAAKIRGACPSSAILTDHVFAEMPGLLDSAQSSSGTLAKQYRKLNAKDQTQFIDNYQNIAKRMQDEASRACSQIPVSIRGVLKNLYHELLQSIENNNNYLHSLQEKSDSLYKIWMDKNEAQVRLRDEVDQAESRYGKDEEAYSKMTSGVKNLWTSGKKKTALENQVTEDRDNLESLRTKLEKTDQEVQKAKTDYFKQSEKDKANQTTITRLTKENSHYRVALDKLGTLSPGNSSLQDSQTITFLPDVEKEIADSYQKSIQKSIQKGALDYDSRLKGVENAINLFCDKAHLPDEVRSRLLNQSAGDLLNDFFTSTRADCMEYYRGDWLFSNGEEAHAILNRGLSTCPLPDSFLEGTDQSLNALTAVFGSSSNLDLYSIHTALEQLDKDPIAAATASYGMECDPDAKVRIPSNVGCIEKYAGEFGGTPAAAQRGYFDFVSKSIDQQKALGVSVCPEFLADQNYRSNFGQTPPGGTCKNGHAMAIVGYRCRNGTAEYLVQNSWGTSPNTYRDNGNTQTTISMPYDFEGGRLWIPETQLVANTSYLQKIVGGE